MQGLAEFFLLVTVSEGILEGEVFQNKFGGTFYSFKGIPYAQPPVGDLRFKAPQPPTNWEGVRSAKEFGSQCYQSDTTTSRNLGSEDCLYLNVYTPNVNPDKLLPVMFWIHGGSFRIGAGDDDYYGPEFLIREDVIIVTINYRLEVLGFLCLDTEDIPGNAGMKDQVAALKWVVKNISKFGGDPNNITIFGESAGGASVSYHLISPMTKGLFKRAIVQSGVAFNAWSQAYKPRDRALALTRQLGFYSEDDNELYEFFKHQPIETLTDISVPIVLSEKTNPSTDNRIFFNIVAEKQFGNEERFFAGDFESVHEDVEIMIGYNSEEGVIGLGSTQDFNKNVVLARDFPEFFVSKPLAVTVPVSVQYDIGKTIRKFYFNDKINLTESWQELMHFYSMNIFQFQIVQFAKLCAKTNVVYLYRFSCKTERNVMTRFYGAADIIGDTPVTAHADDVLYLFDVKILQLPLDVNSETFRLMERVIKLWTNFAKFGNPTPDESLGMTWKPYTEEGQDYFEIANDFFAGTAPDNKDILFWESVYKNINSTDNNGVNIKNSKFLISCCIIYFMCIIKSAVV